MFGSVSLLDYFVEGGDSEKSTKKFQSDTVILEKAVLLEQYGKYWRIKNETKI
jgi:hypothetical protein